MTIKLTGNWSSGLAYDVHILDSVYLGADEYGHDRFQNTRSEMGNLVYQLKYALDLKALKKIIYLLDTIKGVETFDVIVPMAASNTNRPYQPVTEIAKALGSARNVSVEIGSLIKIGSTPQLKNIADINERKELLKSTLQLLNAAKFSEKRVLIVDDLFRSGDSLRAATDLFLEAGAQMVSVLTMTKTRNS